MIFPGIQIDLNKDSVGSIELVKEKFVIFESPCKDTREGDVYIQLLRKLETARESLGDKVFDVLGQLFTANHCVNY